MKIVIGCDPNAQKEKEELIKFIESKGYGEVTDYGSEDPIYANVAFKVAEAVAAEKFDRGILICGTGIGMSIAANKVKGIRACCCTDYFSAKYTRLHNNANCLCMGERVIGPGLAIELVDVFLNTEFEGGRHQTRVDQIMAIENGEKLY